MDNELILFDRINVIRDVINKYGEENFYLSFSGGKDSTVLHYLLDDAIPNNIPRVFIDTGIEYEAIKNFVYKLAEHDNRFKIIKPTQNIRKVLEKYGYPFKSKEHSHIVSIYQNSGMGKTTSNYLGLGETKKNRLVPKCLRYQFTDEFDLKISDKCCYKLKKEPAKKWEKENKKSIVLTGMMNNEGGQRAKLSNCIITDKNGKIQKFHPLLKVSVEWEQWYIETHNIKLCELYYPPYNFNRTGCKGCPFNIKIQKELNILKEFLPNEYKQCELIWKPVYDEYRKIKYRIKDKIEEKEQ